MTAGQIAALLASSAGAGAMNAMAGGGTILTFPTLLLLGVPAITANATSTVALLPGAGASMWAYRREVAEHRRWLSRLLVPSLAGGALGSVLLLHTPEKSFEKLVPFLILFATLLFWVQGALAKLKPAARLGERPAMKTIAAVSLFQFGVAVYGGYFGAGIGILMLAALGFLGLSDIHAMNGLKNFFGMCINVVAAGYFIARGAVAWPEALLMTAGAVAGGYGGARFARGIGRDKARVAVVVIGLFITALLVLRRMLSPA